MNRIVKTCFFTISLVVATATAQEDYSSWAHTKAITLNTCNASGGSGVSGPVYDRSLGELDLHRHHG